MSTPAPDRFVASLDAYSGREIVVMVMGATSQQTEKYVGVLGDIYSECIVMTVANQSVAIRIDTIVSSRGGRV